MRITDEVLSAFLDHELSEPEMDAVREQLALDPGLADRLAELAAVDAELQRHYGAIDDQPMPDSVTRLLDQPKPAASSDNVVAFPWWRQLRAHSGKAVAAAVIAGLAMTQWLNTPALNEPAGLALAEVLEHEASGRAYALSSDVTLTPRLTFQNQAGDWCRQFRVDRPAAASEQIACRDGSGHWEVVAQVDVPATPGTQRYQTASGGSVLDDELDRRMSGSPIAPEAEMTLLETQWSSP
ncbi:anti-sigma factor family protein [Marinobacter halophilus]|uniref:Anti-sigma factor n=1 Tax=Marinobacter halophilus TaxID=1323740 RepID=A0A2T1KIV9_9GAMM|nr:hypothetical protein [Marinobacter halophilus]PSF09542.1 hypothetical protein C7H08_03405 [Marinobacter halophilus]GGC66172.1 hypothetical protein GCM10011362_13220 [Marinobacter halophilus]